MKSFQTVGACLCPLRACNYGERAQLRVPRPSYCMDRKPQTSPVTSCGLRILMASSPLNLGLLISEITPESG